MEIIAGLYPRFEDANRTVNALEEAGFSAERISILAKEKVVSEHAAERVSSTDVAESTGKGILSGSVVGGLLGLLVGVGTITLPGIGAAFATGALATTLGSTLAGAGAGGATGGIIGAMLSLQIPRQHAEIYAEGIRRGGVLVAVQAPEEQARLARRLLVENKPLDVENLSETWDEEVWERFQGLPPTQTPAPGKE